MKIRMAAGLILLAALSLLAGCDRLFLEDGVLIDGEITPSDPRGEPDRNGWTFYSDLYQFWGKADATFEVTINSREGDPLHFQLGELDIDVSSQRGTNSAMFVTPDTKVYNCNVYLREDFVDSGGSSYTLMIKRL
jgi:hypothetical protein